MLQQAPQQSSIQLQPLERRDEHYVIDEQTISSLVNSGQLIARNWITMDGLIGRGHSGSVFKGTLHLPWDLNPVNVAVKTISRSCELRYVVVSCVMELCCVMELYCVMEL